MRILHVSDHYGPVGGAERVLRRVCALLDAAGHDTAVWSAPSESAAATGDRPEHFARATPAAVARILGDVRPDVVHLHNIRDFLDRRAVRMLADAAPVVRTIHDARAFAPVGGTIERASVAARIYRRWVVAREVRMTRAHDALIAPSRYIAAGLLGRGCDPARVHVIHHGVDVPSVRDGAVDDPPRILAVGRLADLKGLPELVRALALLDASLAWRATFVITDDDWRRRIASMADAAGVGDRVECLGLRDADAMHELYARASLVVVPSMIPEAFGLVGLEAMAHAKPVVAFDAGGIPDWLADGVTGLLVPRGDVDALADAIRTCLTDREASRRMGAAGRDRVLAAFTERGHVEALVDVYRRVRKDRDERVG